MIVVSVVELPLDESQRARRPITIIMYILGEANICTSYINKRWHDVTPLSCLIYTQFGDEYI